MSFHVRSAANLTDACLRATARPAGALALGVGYLPSFFRLLHAVALYVALTPFWLTKSSY